MLKRMIKIVPLVMGSMPVVAGAAGYAAFEMNWRFPNLLHPSQMLTENQSMWAFLLVGFLFWPLVGVVLTMPLIKLLKIRTLSRRRKRMSVRSLLGK